MRRSPVVGNLFSGRRALPHVMFTGRALAKQCVPYPVHPVHPVHLANPDSDSSLQFVTRHCVWGCRRRVPMLFDTRVRRNSSTGPTPTVPPEIAA